MARNARELGSSAANYFSPPFRATGERERGRCERNDAGDEGEREGGRFIGAEERRLLSSPRLPRARVVAFFVKNRVQNAESPEEPGKIPRALENSVTRRRQFVFGQVLQKKRLIARARELIGVNRFITS